MRKVWVTIILCFVVIMPSVALAQPSARIKDIAKIVGVRDNQLVGYGIVVGLAGTGDSSNTIMTTRSVANMLQGFGVTISPGQISSKNVAAVMVTATLPPFVKSGDRIDIALSSLGDAKSLQGGTLVITPLKAANGQVYAVGQGPISLGGFAAASGGSSAQKAFATSGRVPAGAIVEREVATQLMDSSGQLSLSLNQPDFTTSARVSDAINERFSNSSQARDPGTVVVNVPRDYRNNVVAFVAALEDLVVQPDAIAKVVINERTGTIVMGDHVQISEVAIAHGSLSVKIQKTPQVSQPPPLSGGTTAVTNQTTVEAEEPQAKILSLPETTSVRTLVQALNAVGAAPSDIIAILQAIKSAGALHAQLEVI